MKQASLKGYKGAMDERIWIDKWDFWCIINIEQANRTLQGFKNIFIIIVVAAANISGISCIYV